MAERALRQLEPRQRQGQAERQLAEQRQLELFRPRPQGVLIITKEAPYSGVSSRLKELIQPPVIFPMSRKRDSKSKYWLFVTH